MTAFTFSVEQIRSAPPEVRRWAVNEIARALGGVGAAQVEAAGNEPGEAEPVALAACTVPQALQIFELIGNDAIAGRLFFELARESPVNSGQPGLHVLRTADLLRHTGLAGNDSLLAGLGVIDRAFRQVCGERIGSLFGFVDAGHVYIHQTTQTSIRRVWEELVRARAAAEHQPHFEAVPRTEGFIPPHLGPSEDIAAHGARSLPETDPPL